MSDLFVPEHLAALAVIAVATAGLIVATRARPGDWIKLLALVLVADEVSWWVYLAAGGQPGVVPAQSLPLQLCDVAIVVAALALWTRHQLLVEVTYFWGLAGTVQALLTPDLPQHFPGYPYFQYYVAHGGVIASAFVLVVGLRIHPRRLSVLTVGALTAGYAVCVGVLDALTGANYMYLRAKPPSPTLLDAFGPWPRYIAVSAGVAIVLFAALASPFLLRRRDRP